MAVIVSAFLDGDWFQELSQGWCHSEETLSGLFGVGADVRSNFPCEAKAEFFDALRAEGIELQKRHAYSHFKSGVKEMPWGIWDPQYLPVGIKKYKKA
jgi:hypothetical protein